MSTVKPSYERTVPESDISSTVRYINRQFAALCRTLGRNHDDLKSIQVDFSYLIDDVMRGFTYRRAKAIQACNDFIASHQPEVPTETA